MRWPIALVALVLYGCEAAGQNSKTGEEVHPEIIATIYDKGIFVDLMRLCDGENLLYVTVGYKHHGLAAVPGGCKK